MLLAPAAYQVPEAAARWLYCDNILVLAHQEPELATMVNSWCRVLKDHPAGPLLPTVVGPRKVSDGSGPRLGTVITRVEDLTDNRIRLLSEV